MLIGFVIHPPLILEMHAIHWSLNQFSPHIFVSISSYFVPAGNKNVLALELEVTIGELRRIGCNSRNQFFRGAYHEQ